jgi:hypothetical protein
MCKGTQEVGSKNAKDRCKCGQSTDLGVLKSKIKRYLEVLTRLRESIRKKRPNCGQKN